MNDRKKENTRAVYFKKARVQRLKEMAEDYTEMIADLIEENGKARICDLAKQMGVSHVNVIKMVKKLIGEGYLVDHIHPLIDLTSKGKEMAIYSKRKHTVLSHFFCKIGVPEHIAEGDVEGIEHHISPEALDALEAHLKKL